MNKFRGNKVVLIGNGAVGSSYALSLVNQNIVDELVIIDLDIEKVRGDVMDLKHVTPYSPTAIRVKAGKYSDCHDVDLVVICAGAAQKPGETHLDSVSKNLKIFKSIVDEAMASKFDGILLVAANPVGILAYATWKLSGLPKERIIGSGTVLDSARFRLLLSEVFDVAPRSVDTQIIGRHGDTELPVWSHAGIVDQPLKTLLEQRPESKTQIEQIFVQIRDAVYDITQAKGATYYGVTMGLARIAEAIPRNEDVVSTVSALLEGEYKEEDVYIGVPTVINRNGIRNVVEIPLNDEEQSKFVHPAKTLKDIMVETEELKQLFVKSVLSQRL